MNIPVNMIEVINRGAYRGLSDEQRDNEWGAQARLARAVYEMEQALKMAVENSALPDIRDSCRMALPAFADFLHDFIPETAQWDEMIEAARHG